MKRFSEEFHKKALTVKLKAAERDALRERVVSYMEYHQLPAAGKRTISKSERILLSEPYRTVSFSWRQLLGFGSVAALVCVVTVSFSAEHAVPGDTLYPVKVKFNEEVRASLAFSPYEKVTWETERLNRRIAEARVLASEGKLTTEVEAEVVAAVRTHSAEARREIDELRATDSDEASLATIHLATVLDVQSAALRQTEGGEETVAAMTFHAATPETQPVPDEESPIAAIASAIEAERRETSIPDESSLPTYDRLLAHAEVDTTRARELLASIEGLASDDEIRDITRRLEDVERLMARALELRPGDEVTARETLTEVVARAQKLIVFMSNIDVRQVLNVEVLVPVELTDEERRVAIADVRGRVQSLVARMETVLPGLTLSVDSAAKVTESLERVDTLLSTLDAALATGDVGAAEVAGTEALGIMTDVAVLAGVDSENGLIVPVPEVPVAAATATATGTVPGGRVEGAVDVATSTATGTNVTDV